MILHLEYLDRLHNTAAIAIAVAVGFWGLALPSGPAAAAEPKGQKVFRVDDYGADPTGKTDSGPGVRKAVAAAVAAGEPARVVFSAGTYRLRPAEGERFCLPVHKASGLTIEGVKGKTEIIVTDPTRGFLLADRCTDFLLRDLSIDNDPLPFTQGVVRAVDPAKGTFDLEIDPGFPLLDEPWFAEATRKWGMIFDAKQRRLKTCGVDHIFVSSWTHLKGRSFRVAAEARQRHRLRAMEPGDRWVHLARRVGETAITLRWCDGCRIENVTVLASPSAAVVVVGCTRPVVRRLSVRFRPRSKRLLTTNADGVHCAQNRTGPVIEECFFEGMADDSINIYCRPSVVLEVISPKQLVLGGQTRILPGDRMQVLDPRSGRVKGELKVAAVSRQRRRLRITLAEPFPGIRAGKDHTNADTLFDLDACGAGYVIRNNHMRLHRRHGMLLRAGDGLVEGNRIERVSGLGIVVTNEPDWPEGPMARNVTIRNNTVVGCGYTSYGHNVDGGLIQVRGVRLGHQLARGHGQRGITIEGNTLIDPIRTGIYIGSAEDVRIANNVIRASRTASAGSTGSSAGVVLENCGKVVIDELDLTDLRPTARAAVRILKTVDAGTGGVTVKGLHARLPAGVKEILDEREP